jgi:hypothetical protein
MLLVALLPQRATLQRCCFLHELSAVHIRPGAASSPYVDYRALLLIRVPLLLSWTGCTTFCGPFRRRAAHASSFVDIFQTVTGINRGKTCLREQGNGAFERGTHRDRKTLEDSGSHSFSACLIGSHSSMRVHKTKVSCIFVRAVNGQCSATTSASLNESVFVQLPATALHVCLSHQHLDSKALRLSKPSCSVLALAQLILSGCFRPQAVVCSKHVFALARASAAVEQSAATVPVCVQQASSCDVEAAVGSWQQV